MPEDAFDEIKHKKEDGQHIGQPARRSTMGARNRSSEAVVGDVNMLLVQKHIADEEAAEEEKRIKERAKSGKVKKQKLKEAKKARAAKMKELMDNGQDAAKAKKQKIQAAKKAHGTLILSKKTSEGKCKTNRDACTPRRKATIALDQRMPGQPTVVVACRAVHAMNRLAQ